MALTPIPVASPVVDDKAKCTVPWVMFFNSIPKTSGGGGGGGGTPGAWSTVTVAGGMAAIDLSNGLNWNTYVIPLGATPTLIQTPTGGTAGQYFTIVMKQDGTGGRSNTWDTGYKGVADQAWTAAQVSVYWSAAFVIRDDGFAMRVTIPVAGEAY